MTSTLTLLPGSPLNTSQRPFEALSTGSCPSIAASDRPKLSLNTACSRPQTLGKSNTGLRVDALSADSATIRNTFRNCYDPPVLPGASVQNQPRSCASPSKFLTEAEDKPPTPHPLLSTHSQREKRKSAELASPGSATDINGAPYSLGKHPRSILTNGPFAKRRRSNEDQRTATGHNDIDGESSRRVAFPEQLSEEIRNFWYTAQHIDLLNTASPSPASIRPGSESAVAHDVREDSDDESAYPKTPVAGRKKRRRDWVWTLGPVQGDEEVAVAPTSAHVDVPRLSMPKVPNKAKQ